MKLNQLSDEQLKRIAEGNFQAKEARKILRARAIKLLSYLNKDESPYEASPIAYHKGSSIVKDAAWILFSESNHGTVYWNEFTGEIMWLSEHSDESNISRLTSK